MTEPQPPLPKGVRDAIVARHAADNRPLWREPLFLIAAVCVVAALTVIVLWVRGALNDANHRTGAPCTSNDRRGPCILAAQAQQAVSSANKRLESAGQPTVQVPTSTVPVPTVTVTVAPQPPSQASVELAVSAYCTRVSCSRGPTAGQVAQAVATFCNVDGRCRGPVGASGKNGTGAPGAAGASGASGAPGANGAPGADGQNATSDQVAAAVASYCADHNQCQGPPGEPGPSGLNGDDGQPPFSWTYTDLLGQQHTCVRTSDFDPDRPTYTCQ